MNIVNGSDSIVDVVTPQGAGQLHCMTLDWQASGKPLSEVMCQRRADGLIPSRASMRSSKVRQW